MVEGAGLENRRPVKNGSGGSNPSPSAIKRRERKRASFMARAEALAKAGFCSCIGARLRPDGLRRC